MDLKFYTKNKQVKLFWIKTIALVIFSGIFSFGNASAQLNSALDFPNPNSLTQARVEIQDQNGVLNITGAITIETWINAKGTGTAKQNVIAKSGMSANNSYIFPRTENTWGNLQFWLKLNGSSTWTVLSVPYKNRGDIFNNTWHHVAATYDGSFMRIYIDGVLQGTPLAASGAITTNNNPLVIGGQYQYTNEYFNGRADEVRIWKRALSQCEIVNNMSCELVTNSTTDLQAYYKFDALSSLVDATVNNLTGTLVNLNLLNFITTSPVNGNCTVFTPIVATAGSVASNISVGETLQLTASGGASYVWTGPNGFYSTQQNPTIPNAQLNNTGTYQVTATQGGCSATASTIVTVANPAKALLFDGNNDMIRIPNSSSVVSNTFTIETWVKPESNTPLIQNVVSKMRLSPDAGYIFPRTDDGWLNFSIWLSVNGQGVTVSAPYPSLGGWNHVAATYDGFNVKLYLNGNLVKTQAIQGYVAGTSDITLGMQDGFAQYYKGGLDELRIWKRALTQCEIQNNLTCELNGANNAIAAITGLGAYYRFNQGLANANNTSRTTLVDSSGNGNNGTLMNFDLTGSASNWSTGGTVNNATCSVFQELVVTASSNGPIVEVGNTVQLSANGGTNWSWTGPGGFTSNLQNPTIPSATLSNSGDYTVSVQRSGCSLTASTKVTVAFRAYSLNLDGDNDEVTVPASAPLNTISKGITMEAWIYPTSSVKPIQDVMSKSSRDVNTGYIFPRTDNGWASYVFYLHVNGEWQKLDAPYPGLNQWHHVAATYDGYFMRIYLDGVLSASKEIYGTITQNLNDLIIGQQPGYEEHFKGSVDEARIWDRALNQCEIMNSLYCEVHPLQRNGLVAYYKFNQGFDNADNTNITTVIDSSSYANNGLIQNFAMQGAGSNWVLNFSSNRSNSICAYKELPNVTAFANGTIFSPGSTIKLFGNGGFDYHWDGPQGFHSDYRNPTIYSAQLPMSGIYTLTAPFVNCEVKTSTKVQVTSQPLVFASGPLTFCPSGSVTLSTTMVGTSYQWYRDDIAIQNANSNSYVATQSGLYTLNVISATDVVVSEPITVTVEDTEAPVPVIASLPVLTLSTPATITSIPMATDNCSGTITATTQNPLTYLYEGNYTITWTYDDHNGHVVTQTQDLIVTLGVDYRPPVLTVPANISLNGDANICGAIANFTATATDNSPDPVTITYSKNPGTVFPAGTTIVTVTATDATGNVMTGTFTVDVSPAVVAPITGNTILCANATTTLSNATTGGSWSSANTGIATVDAGTGVVTGVSAGSVSIIYTTSCGTSISTSVTVKTQPAQPIVTVTDNCGNSTLTVNNASGSLLWSNNATTASITVTEGGVYTVSQTINGCTSVSGSGMASPKSIPTAPVVTVADNCGSSILTVSGAAGSLLWSNNATTASITVTQAGNYTVTQTVNGCASPVATVTAAPKAVPAAPAVTVVNNCGNSTLTASAFTGSLLWSNNATTASINVTQAGVYTVTQTIDGCSSPAGSATASPNATPAAPVVTVADNCGTSTLTASGVTGSLLWSNNATTASITVTQAGNYTVTQTVNGCTSLAATATAAPKAAPVAPAVTVVNNCGNSTLTVSGFTGSLLWSNNATTASINVTQPGNYTVTQTVDGCTSATGSGNAMPKLAPAAPVVTVVDNCGTSTLTASGFTGSLLWSNNATTASITVTQPGNYTVTQTVDGCTSATGSGNAVPKLAPAAPVVTVVDNCGTSTLTASGFTGSLLWSNNATTTSITVTQPGNYTVTQTVNGCTSVTGSGNAIPKLAPATPVVTVVNNCGSSTLSVNGATGSLLWSNGATTASITVPAGTYSVTQTLNGCTSAAGVGTAVPKTFPVAPVVTVVDNCGNSVLTASGSNLLWSTGETTASITVTQAGTYTVTQTVNGCTSPADSVVATVVGVSVPVIAGPTSGTTVTQNPLQAALDFNVFVQNNASAGSSQSHGPVAVGGNFTLNGDYSVSNNSAGTFKVSNVPVTLVVGGKMVYQGGNGMNVNQNGYVKIGDATGSYVWYTDQNNAYSPIRITPGANYNGSPRINLQANAQQLGVSATNNPVFQGGLINFATAFTQLQGSAASLSAMADNANLTNANGGVIAHTGLPSQVKINLAAGVNVLNISAGDLNNVQNFTYNTQPDASHILVINVNAPGTFNWNVWNSGGIGDGNTKYILYNFYNTTSLTVQGNGSVMGSLLAPAAVINKSNSQNISGQIIGQTYTQTGGTNTYNKFEGTITSGSTTVIAANSNNTRTANNNSCSYTVNGAEFNATVSAACGTPVLTYTLSGATTGSGSNLAGVTLNSGVTTVTWTATNGTASATYAFTVTVQPNTPATPVVTIANNCGNTVLSTNATGSLLWSTGETTPSINVLNGGTYSVTQTVNGCVSAAGSGLAVPVAIPAAPIVSVVNNCGNAVLSTNATGSLLWSNNATTASINVANSGTYTVVQTVNGCTSAAGSGIAAPVAVPAAPVVTVSNNCGNTVLSTNATGSLLWSNNATTPSITVNNNSTYSVTQTVNGCTSAFGSGVAAPLAIPAAPVVTVANNCGNAVLSADATGSLLWSNNATTPSINVINGGTYSVTQTVNGCVSAAGSGIAAPVAIPAAPIVNVANNCGNTVLSTNATGSLLWSNNATTPSITVNNNGTYSVTQTVNGCTSASGSGVAAPLAIPAAPVVTVSNNCGNAVLSTDATGSLLWSNNATTPSITVNNNGTYSVTQTANGCTSAAGSGIAAPIAVPAAPVVTVSNNCGTSVLSTNAAGSLLWSTGATGSSIVVPAGSYSVTQTVNGCTSTAGVGSAAPVAVPAAPIVNVVNNCGNTVLSTNAAGSLLWSNGSTGSSITVNSNGTYSVAATVNGCVSSATAVPVTINAVPTVSPVSGAATVASGSSTQFNDATNGGVWSSSNTNIATVSASGLVTGVAVGTTTINYTVSTLAGCSATVSANITVTANCIVPAVTAANVTAGTLPGATGCNSPVTYSVNTSGTNPVTLSYVLTGATTGSGAGTGSGVLFNVGVTTVKVTATNACGTSSTSFTVTLRDATAPVPVVSNLPVISGQCSVNLGSASSASSNGCQDDCNCCRYVCYCRTSSCNCRSYDYNYRNIISYLISYLYNYYYGDDDDHGCDHGDDNSGNSNAPKATDNCKGTIVATTTDPLSYNNQGTYTIHWKYDDGNGNITMQDQTVIVKDDTKPVINVPSNITLNCGASTTPSSCGNATATDNCGGVTISYTDANGTGTQILRTWTATDAAGNFSTATQTITIVDNTKPVISDVADVTVNCNGSTDPSVTGRPTATDCSAVTISYTDATNGNVITRTWRATDAFNNYSTSTQIITKGASFNVDISSVPTSSTYTGGIATNLYLGYGAQSTTLQTCALPSSGAPYTYTWSGTATNRLNSTSSSAPVFTPATYGSYMFTVTVTNKYGCTSTDYITICVTDVRVPGSNGKKVYVCHQNNGKYKSYQTIEVSISAVPTHIGGNGCGNKDYDDRLGSCDQAPCGYTAVNSIVSGGTKETATQESGVSIQKTAEVGEPIKVIVMPNPSTTYFTLKFESKSNTPMNLRVMDGNGRVVDARSAIVPNSSLQIGHNYTSGTYYAEVIQGGQRKVVQLIKARG